MLVLVGLWAAWNVQHFWREAQTSRARLDRKTTELAGLLGAGKSAGADLENASVAELDRVRGLVARRKAAFRKQDDVASAVSERAAPDNTTDAFFDLAVFSERMRARAREMGVVLKPDERFGFADYASTGPANGKVRAVHAQRVLVAYLLEKLFAAGPHELVSVERERVEEGQRDDSARVRGLGGHTSDYFELERRLTMRVPGLINTTAFRVGFKGMTETLRAFLNALAQAEVPNAIRSVDVAPQYPEAGGGAAGVTSRGDRALVVPGELHFTVTVEFLALAEPMQPPDER